MSDTMDREALGKVLDKYGTPPKDLVFKKGSADYVGHADITAILIKIDPCWSWEPQAWAPEGGPLVVDRGGRLTMWGWMTVHGKRLPCVGTVESKKLDQADARQGPPEVDKELIGDLIRNGAMRFGIGLNLWTKADWAEPGEAEASEPESSDFHGWPSRAAHDAWWEVQSQRIKALPDKQRYIAIGVLGDVGAFTGRKPNLPIPNGTLRNEVESALTGAEIHAGTDGPSDYALQVMAEARGIEDPLNPPDDNNPIEPWMWDLADVQDLDAHDWKVTAKAANVRQRDLVDIACGVAKDKELPEPDGITDIHGALAVELRAELLRGEPPF